MLKNIIKVCFVSCAMFFAVNANAQEKTYAPVYPQYSFWSNWSLGAELGYAHQFTNGLDWVHGSNAGWQIMAEKELRPAWTMRLSGGVPAQWAHPSTNENGDAYTCQGPNSNGRVYDRFADLKFGFKLNLNSACKGYNPERKNEFYLLANTGLSFMYKEAEFGKVSTLLEAGIGFNHKVCEHGSFFIEATLNDIADIRNPLGMFRTVDATNFNTFIGAGWMYNFGPTAADLEIIAQRAKLTQENFDNMEKQISDLNNQLANSKQAEQRLQKQINDLEDQLAAALKNPRGGANSDSLRAVLDQMKADQLNYYALPFSILYDVDQYRVSDDQMAKVKAIARVIKDTENAKFKVVGFCDKSGSDEYNMKLSKKRAEELKRLLVKEGVAEDRIDVDYKGKGMAFGDISYSVNRRTSVYRVME